jgi:hypothetical protein
MNSKLGSHKLMNNENVWYKFYLRKPRILMATDYNELRIMQDLLDGTLMDLNEKVQRPK